MIERLFSLIVDQNNLASPKDELSIVIKDIGGIDGEMDETMLEQVTAAKLEMKHTHNTSITDSVHAKRQ